jgi:uncharacterized protein (TIGR03000 family)
MLSYCDLYSHRNRLVVLCSLLASVAIAQPPNPFPAGGVRSKAKVLVPQADAELFIEKAPTKTQGKVREFDTPEMEAGKRYVYDFKVVWKPNKFTTITRTATRKFSAGDELNVDLTQDEGNDKTTVSLKPPTNDVIAELVKISNPTKDDIVFELGGSDARLLIASTKAGAKRAVGVQPDADRVKDQKDQIKKADLEGKIDIQPTDIREGRDYSEATIVFLYLGEEVNTAMQSVLLRDLKPGARIISYRFKMGNWTPTTTTPGVNADGDNFEIYTWVVAEGDKFKYGKK